MKPTLLTVFLLILFSHTSFGQKEHNIWCFGRFAGLNFNVNPPTPFIDSYMNTYEGCASVSDTSGKLLFYTNGVKIWDSTHNVMPNGSGLGGAETSTQSGSIVQVGLDTYMVFATERGGESPALTYSVVDMTQNSGKGDVVKKNQVIHQDYLGEKLAVLEHSDGHSFWVVVKDYDSSIYYSYKITGTNVTGSPVTSIVGEYNDASGVGYMKSSHDQRKIAVVEQKNGVELFDFDATTGKLFNSSIIESHSYDTLIYGVEFSPDNRFLYTTGTLNAIQVFTSSGFIDQYDISLSTDSAIRTSKVRVYNHITPRLEKPAAIELGPDEKMYFIISRREYVSVINYPNLKGDSCDIDSNAIWLGAGHIALSGLPTYYGKYYPYAKFYAQDTCYGDTTKFTIEELYPYDSIKWDFGDITSGVSNFSYDTFSGHVFTDTGTYQVKLMTFRDTIFDTIVSTIRVHPFPNISLPMDTTLCEGLNLVLDFSSMEPANFLWSDSSILSIDTLNTADTHWVVIQKNGCMASDTTVINIDSIFKFYIPDDTSFCKGDTVLITADTGADKYNWSTGSDSNSSYFTVADTAVLKVTKGACITVDSIIIGVRDLPVFNLGNDTVLCQTDSIIYNITFQDTGYTYKWYNGSVDSSINIVAEDTVWALVEKDGCYFKDTIYAKIDSNYKFYLAKDTFVCDKDTLPLDIGMGADTYNWSNGSNTQEAYFTNQGTYTLTTTRGVCIKTDSIFIEVKPLPIFELGNDTNLCSTDSIVILGTGSVKYLWNNGDTNQSLKVKLEGQYILTQTNQYCQYTDTIQVGFRQQPNLNIGNDTVLCLGEEAIIGDTTLNAIQYTWSHLGDTSAKVRVSLEDTYRVTAFDGVCYSRDTVFVGVYNPQSIELGADSTLCEGSAIELDATITRGQYLWDDGIQTPVRSISTPGTYSIKITDSVCSYADTITLTFTPKPILNLGLDTVLCQDEIHEVTINADWDKVTWSDGSNDFTRIFTTEGEYKVTANYLNCEDKDTIVIGYHPPLPNIDLGPDIDICNEKVDRIISPYSGYYGVQWHTGSKLPYIIVNDTGLYTLTTLPHRCGQVGDEVNITYSGKNCIKYVTSAFTPNGDGLNDLFIPMGLYFEVNNLEIFTRWGQKVYEGKEGWDGTHQGVDVEVGAYLYIVHYIDSNNNEQTLKGTVQLLR